MKVIEISIKENKEEINIIDFFHKFAEANGSKYKIDLIKEESATESSFRILSKGSYSNSEYTVGYFALLYTIDKLCNYKIAHTFPCSKAWFYVEIETSQIKELIKILS